mgnify:CR=1 FL=1
MRRTVKITLIVSAVLAAMGILLVIVTGCMGGHFSDLWNSRMQIPGVFHFGSGVTAPHNEYNKSNTYSISAEGIDGIQIDWVSDNVVIKIGNTEQIAFSETGAGLTEKTALRYDVQGSTLLIHYCDDQRFLNVNLPAKQLTVILPDTLAANLQSLSVETVSADVTIDDPLFRMEKLDVETVSGNLNAVIDFAGIAELETVSGNLGVNGGINKFDAESSSGNVSIGGGINQFEAETVSGDVLLDCRNGVPNDLDIETTSGNVILYLPQNAALTLAFETVSGDFDSICAMSVHNGNYVIGSGHSNWRVETVSGDLTVK